MSKVAIDPKTKLCYVGRFNSQSPTDGLIIDQYLKQNPKFNK